MVLPWALRKHMQRDVTSSGRFRTNRGSCLGAHTQQQRQSGSCSGHCRSICDKQQPASRQSRFCLGCVPHWQWRQDAAAGLATIEVVPPVRSSLAGAAPRLLRHGPFHHPAGVARVAPKGISVACMTFLSIPGLPAVWLGPTQVWPAALPSRVLPWAPPRCQAGFCPGHRNGRWVDEEAVRAALREECPPPHFKILGTLKSFHQCAARRYERAQ